MVNDCHLDLGEGLFCSANPISKSRLPSSCFENHGDNDRRPNLSLLSFATFHPFPWDFKLLCGQACVVASFPFIVTR